MLVSRSDHKLRVRHVHGNRLPGIHPVEILLTEVQVQLLLLVIRQPAQVIMAAGVADGVYIIYRDTLKIPRHHPGKVISVHLHQGRRGFRMRLCQLLLPASEHPLHEPLRKARVPGQRHAVEPGAGNVERRVEEQPPADGHAEGGAVDQRDLRAAHLKQTGPQRFC